MGMSKALMEKVMTAKSRTFEDYTSNNTRILDVEEIKEVLLKVGYIQEELKRLSLPRSARRARISTNVKCLTG
jgi:hypothetical protein